MKVKKTKQNDEQNELALIDLALFGQSLVKVDSKGNVTRIDLLKALKKSLKQPFNKKSLIKRKGSKR